MVGDLETLGMGNIVLTLLNAGVEKLFNAAAIKAHQVVMVLALVEGEADRCLQRRKTLQSGPKRACGML